MVTLYVLSLDVWGNAEDGFEINDRFRAGTIDVHESFLEKRPRNAILQALRAQGFLRRNVRGVEIDDDGNFFDGGFVTVSDRRDGRPVFQVWSTRP